MSGMRQVHFARLPISLPCPVPVKPGTPDTMDEHGEPLPMDQRTERCAVDAFWMIGAQITCDIHLRVACDVLDLDYDGLLREAAEFDGYDRDADKIVTHWREKEAVPWAERPRYSQDEPFPGDES